MTQPTLYEGPQILRPPFRPPFWPKPTVVAYSAALAGAAYTAPAGMVTDKPSWIRVRLAAKTFLFIGGAAPADDAGSEYLLEDTEYIRFVPEGEKVFFKRTGNANQAGSVEQFAIEDS